ncbi:MAG: aminotransferase class I/II-fold pyridoxal phosphate-dependent enzyme [Trueperaceae bacterium]
MSDNAKANVVSARIDATLEAMSPFLRFFQDSAWSGRDPKHQDNCDFVFGNPHEMPLPEFVSSLQRNLPPQDQDWYAYKVNEPESRRTIAESLRERRGLPFEPQDVFVTNGAFAALSVSICTLIDPGDEIIFISPPWFFYESIIVNYGGNPVRVKIDDSTLDLDLEAIAAAITKRTRAIIVNSPNNPTGKIFPPETLQALANLLTEASERNGSPIYLLSDEAYSRIIFDDLEYPSPTSYYPNSLLIYTYGKTLLTPGQRIGYIALPPTMPSRAKLRNALLAAQLVTGFAFPNALLQHSLAELETLSIDIPKLQRKRDRLTDELGAMGYEVKPPEGTFYLLVRSPLHDDLAFCEALAAQKVYVLPGTVFEMPGFFRISLTANDEMVERSLPGFAAALKRTPSTIATPAEA